MTGRTEDCARGEHDFRNASDRDAVVCCVCLFQIDGPTLARLVKHLGYSRPPLALVPKQTGAKRR